jgi:DNA-binding NtrC family response regulator
VLETGVVRRLGDTRERAVDFRLVAATNRDLRAEVDGGRFRADLFYRLDGLRVDMPALRGHPEDIPALVEHFLRSKASEGQPAPEISRPVLVRLCEREWPGNVRELFNELARLTVLSEGALDDPDLVRAPHVGTLAVARQGEVRPMAALEREAIEHALQKTGGDKRKAADLLGISRAKIYQRLKEWREPS